MIRFENVRKTLSGKEILRGVNLHVRPGETMVIVGGSGTGKSVSLKHMVGLMAPDEGRVIIDGDDISHMRSGELAPVRDKFGVLFQSGALLNWMTVEQNVALPLYEKTRLSDDEIQQRVDECLRLVSLTGSEKKYPSEISGGMKKRAGLARAIATRPKILLYDEPTSGLDPVMSRVVDKLISDLQQELKVTSVVVTHDMVSALSIADRITMLYQGQVAEVGTPQEFIQSNHPYVKEFIHAQFQAGKVEGINL